MIALKYFYFNSFQKIRIMRNPFLLYCIYLCSLIGPVELHGQAADGSVTLPAGTVISLYTNETIDSGSAEIGHTVDLFVRSQVNVSGNVIINTDAIGTAIVRVVEKACSSRCGFQEAKITIVPETVQTIDGQTIYLRGMPLARTGDGYKHTEAEITVGTLLSARVLNNTKIYLIDNQ